ncbi:hypothetical protein GCM10009101_32160 [Brevundimonas lenta]
MNDEDGAEAFLVVLEALDSVSSADASFLFGDHVLARGGRAEPGSFGDFGIVLRRPATAPDEAASYAISIGELSRMPLTDDGANEMIVVALPRSAAPAWILKAKAPIDIPAGSAVGRLIANLAATAVKLADTMKADEGEAVLEAVLVLAEQALEGERQAALTSNAEAGGAAFTAAVRHIEAHILSPDLGVDSLTQALGLSRATLYRSFLPAGGVNTFIRQRRLELARQVLAGRTGPHPTISEIAHAHGFASESHFSRAFRKAFGHAPGARKASEKA